LVKATFKLGLRRIGIRVKINLGTRSHRYQST